MQMYRFMRSYDCLYVYVYVYCISVLDLVRMILLMFFGIWKSLHRSWGVEIIAKAHLSQPNIVHVLGVSTFGMSIAGIRHVDSWGVAPPTSVYAIGVWVSEQWANNGFYVMRSIVMLLLSGMLVQYGSLGMSSISFLVLRIFKFYVLNDQETIQLIVFSLLFVFQPDCIDSWGFVLAVFWSC